MSPRRVFLGIYLVSGIAALLYEVTWTRLLSLHMGHTMAAVSTVLAAFMGGLAAGAAIAGRRASTLTRERALRLYACLEIAIGGCALLLPLALTGLQPMLAWAYHNGDGGALFGLTRLLSSLVLVALPATAMGATWPLAARFYVGPVERAGKDAGGLYAANTVGAAIGAGMTGFVLLPVLSLWTTSLVGISLNALAAGGAFWLSRRESAVQADGASAPRRKNKSKRKKGQEPAVPGRLWLAATTLAVSGFVALVYEVVWTRVIALIVGPTTYAFSAMLTAFICGLALGSAIAARFAGRLRPPAVWLGLTLMLAALGTFAVMWWIGGLPLIMARQVAVPDAQFQSVMKFQTALIAALLLPMTTALGMAFPLAIALAARRTETVSYEVAVVYAMNTIGAIAGALAAGFVLIPLLGLQASIRAAGLLAIGAGFLVISMGGVSKRSRSVALAVFLLAAAAGAALPKWNRELLSAGAYKYAPYLANEDLPSALEAGTLLYYAEGAAGVVSVHRVADVVSLAIDGKVDASNSADMLTQKLLAHLPLLLHPDPKRVAIIGLGSGVTLGAALRHPIAVADTLEISPEVVEASSFFDAENHAALEDPRTHLILGDGRTHLFLSSQSYDVIISEPSNPWMAGVATLFTREFFQAARARLAPGGILCQWAHTYDISDADFRSIVATFTSVFPEGTMWLVGEADVLLIGSNAPLGPRLEVMSTAWDRPGVAADLEEVKVHSPFSLLSLFVAGGDSLRRYTGDARVQTDAYTSLEFSAPRSIYGYGSLPEAGRFRKVAESAERPAAVQRALDGAGAVDWRDRGAMNLATEAYAAAFEDLARAARMDATDPVALEGLTRAAVGADREKDALALLQSLAASEAQNVPVRVELSHLSAASGRFEEAIHWAEEALSIQPGNSSAREQLASLFADMGDQRLRAVVATMISDTPDLPGTLYYSAAMHFLDRQFGQAAALAERVVDGPANSFRARAYNLLGAAYASQGMAKEALSAFQAAVAADPRDPTSHINLGLFELDRANPRAAAEHFAVALRLDPQSPQAQNALADALEQQGEVERANRLRQRLPPGI